MGRRRRRSNSVWHCLLFRVVVHYVILLLVVVCSAEMAMSINIEQAWPSPLSLGPTVLRKVQADGMVSNVTWIKLEEEDEADDLFGEFDSISVYHFVGEFILHEHGALHRELTIMLPAMGFHDDGNKNIVLTYLPVDAKFSLVPALEGGGGGGGDNETMNNNQAVLTWNNRGNVVKAINIQQDVWHISTFLGKCNPMTYQSVLDFSRQYAINHPVYQPFSVSKYEDLILPSSTPDDFVWSILYEMINLGVKFHNVLGPTKIQVVLFTSTVPQSINYTSEEVSGFYKSLTGCLNQPLYSKLKTMKDLVLNAYKYECLRDYIYLPVVPTTNDSDASNNTNTAPQYRKIKLVYPTIKYIEARNPIDKQEIEKEEFSLEDIFAGCVIIAIVIIGTMLAIFNKIGCYCCCMSKKKWDYSQLVIDDQTTTNETADADDVELRSSEKEQYGDLCSDVPKGLRNSKTEFIEDDLSSFEAEEIADTLETSDKLSL